MTRVSDISRLTSSSKTPTIRIEGEAVSKPLLKILTMSLLPLFLTGCGFQEYIAKPIDIKASAEKFNQRNVNEQKFHEYLIYNGYQPAQLPIRQWSADDLVYCALFFNPSLDLARAQWRSAEAAKLTAADPRLPTLSGKYGKSNNANDEISPYTYALSIDLPIETANKRNIRIESAQHLSEATKLNIAQSAWQLRSEVTRTLFELLHNRQLVKLLTTEQALKQQVVNIFEKRLGLGESSSSELNRARLLLQDTITERNAKQRNDLVLLARLASQLGMPLNKVEQMPLANVLDATSAYASAAAALQGDLQTQALLNRLDIRIALERYAAAETKVKLEIARQYPDINFSPNHTYEFGNRIWQLGLSGLMTIITKNKMPIAEAKQLREVEAAQFDALQANVIAEINTAQAKVMQAKQILENQQLQFAQQEANTKRVERKFDAGEADRLELTYAKLEQLTVEKNSTLANYQLISSLNELENFIQAPLIGSRINNETLDNISSKNLNLSGTAP